TCFSQSPPPKTGAIPIFARRDYRYHLKIDKVLLGDDSTSEGFTARFQVYKFDSQTEWPNPGIRTISLKRADPPEGSGYPRYFTGNMLDEETGDEVGTVSMGWVSAKLRSAFIIVD